METSDGLRMPFGVSATDEKRILERQTHSQYVDAVNPMNYPQCRPNSFGNFGIGETTKHFSKTSQNLSKLANRNFASNHLLL